MSFQPTEFYVAGGTLPPDSPSYIVRAADETLHAGLTAGRFCYVLTSRQMGKSSLMHHTAGRLRAEGYTVVTLDLSKIGTNLTLDQWYYSLLRGVGQQLRMQPSLTAHWEQHAALSPLQRLFTALDEQVAPACAKEGLILFVDEIDTVRRLPFSADEFFAAIRERHNARAVGEETHRVTFCLLGVASPANLIADPRTTPFNIGLRIELTDFTPEEATPLAEGLEPDAQPLLARILHWTGGHPYLTQRLCLDLAEQAQSGAPVDVDRRCAALFFGSRARQEETNLAFVQNTLLQLSDDVVPLLELYRRIRRGQRVPDDPTSPEVTLLCLSGLVRPENGRLIVRNRIYRRVFDLRWIEESMPGAESRRQRAAYRRGAIRALAVSALVLAVVGGLGWNAVLNAHRAEQAAQLAAKNAGLYREARDIALRKTAEAEQAANLARAETRRAETEALRRKAALDQATLARTREETAHLKTLTLLAEAQADQGVQALERGDATGLLDLAASCRTVRESPAAYARRAALWNCWYTSCDVELAQLISLNDHINHIGFMPGDGRLVTGSADGSIRFWNLHTGKPEGTPLTPHGPVDLLAISPDGRYLAASTHDHGWLDEGRVVLWDARTARPIPIDIAQAQKAQMQRSLGTSPSERTIFQIVFTPDSRKLAVVLSATDTKGGVLLFDAKTGTQQGGIMTYKCDAVQFARHAPVALLHLQALPLHVIDTRSWRTVFELAYADFCSLHDDGRLVAQIDSRGRSQINNQAIDNTGTGAAVAFQPGGNLLAWGGSDGLIYLYRIPSLDRSKLPPALGRVVEMRFAPDGRSLAVRSPKGVTVYRLDTGEVMQRLISHEDIEQIEYTPDSAAVAVHTGNTVRLWRLHSGQEQGLRLLGHGRPAIVTGYSQDGRYVATCDGEGTLRVLDARTGRQIGRPMPHSSPVIQKLGSLGFTPDGGSVLVAGKDWRLHCRDWRGGRERWQTPAHERDIRALAISPDGRHVATAAGLLDEFCTVRQWDMRTGRLLWHVKEPDIANGMAYSPDGTRLLMVGRAHTAALRDAATGAAVGHRTAVGRVHRQAARPPTTAPGPGPGGGLWAGRSPYRHGVPERDRAVVGCRHRPAAWHADGP
jgi:WD40 repeat protein